MTPKMLKQWRDDRATVEDSRSESPFIAVTLTAEPVVSETLPVDLTLTLQEPNRVRIQGQLTLCQLTALMRGLGVSGEGVMIQLMAHSHVLLARHPADFRRGIDSFQALCRDQLKQNPRQDTWFVFLNRNRTQIRLLRYDGNGFWLMTKRLSSGRFSPGAGLLEEPAGY